MVFLVVASNVLVKDRTIDIFCENTPTVGWVRKLSSKSPSVARLMRMLALVMKEVGVSPLIALSIEGSSKKEDDFESRLIFVKRRIHSNLDFLMLFNKHFPTKEGFNLAQLSKS